jgi:8-oxo-dGTP pyrophosphatase MutT (NUDIX family)
MAVFDEVIRGLREEMERGLPGWDAQKRMIVPERPIMDIEKIKQRNPKESSVMVWLYPKGDEIFTRLIHRTEIGKVHGGQIAFPGGRYEEKDPDMWSTALREAYEEVGLVPGNVKKVGEMSLVYIPPSNFWVHPFIGYSEMYLPFTIQPAEVQRTIDMNLQLLLDPTIKDEKLIVHSNTPTAQATPYYNIEGYTVWGATAMILSELEELLRRVYKRMG